MVDQLSESNTTDKLANAHASANWEPYNGQRYSLSFNSGVFSTTATADSACY